MKKYLSLLLALLLCLSLTACGGSKEETKTEEPAAPAATEEAAPAEAAPAEEPETEEPAPEAETVNVFVTISDAGALRVNNVQFAIVDEDGDGAVPVDAAIAAAHDACFEGGAEAGFVFEETEYGMSIIKLWGVENGGSYGYYVNNAYVLPDYQLVEGDYICAYSYADLTGWSDCYSYFDQRNVEAAVGEEITLQLSMLAYDENWTLQTLPVEGATIIVNGELTNIVTDAEGVASGISATAGEYVVSAVGADGTTLVPPVCLVTVK